MRSNDALHLGLMLLALAAAYLVPFELLLLAYVVLARRIISPKSRGCMIAATICLTVGSRSRSRSSPWSQR